VNRLAGELGVCRVGLPTVASRNLHPAPPESYTIFMAGCNFKCLNCQNWTISQFPDNQMPVEGTVDPDHLARQSVKQLDSPSGVLMGADRIFFSGGEPSIHLPFIEQVVSEARKIKPECKVNFDTNGFLTTDALHRVLSFTTSITFDLKAYHDDIHRALTGAPVEPVLRNAAIVAREAPEKLWEFRITVIPGINEQDIGPICQFVAGLRPDLPVCFLAFRPNFVLERHPGATLALMSRCMDLAVDAGLDNATCAGVTEVPGQVADMDQEMEDAYPHEGARLGGTYAARQGCDTHPRDCLDCSTRQSCPLKVHIPRRSC
jgi:pyruvate formate lyase activating enzyme